MIKKYILLVSLGSTVVLAEDISSENSNRVQYQEAVCRHETRCGFKTACTWACIALSTTPAGKWWKTYAIAVGSKYCGDLCEKIEECKEGYFCDAY